MRKNILRLAIFALLIGMITAACLAQTTGGVYINTNQTNNEVWAYTRASDGTLTLAGKFSTQGNGSNTSHLESQGSIILSKNGKFLFVVNAVSNDITSFAVGPNAQLSFIGRYPSGGLFPNSLALRGNTLYVTNYDSDMIAAFRANTSGMLQPIANSKRRLSGTGVGVAQVSFTPDGKLLVVTEKLSDKIDVFTLGTDGRTTSVKVQASNGLRPLGFAFDPAGHLIVSEVRASAASSYLVAADGTLSVITGSLLDFGQAACWAVVTNNATFPNQYAYITNTLADTISGYKIAADGSLSLVNSNGITAQLPAGAFPLDEALSSDSKYLYALEGHLAGVIGFQINSDGSLVSITQTTGAPHSSFGLAGN